MAESSETSLRKSIQKSCIFRALLMITTIIWEALAWRINSEKCTRLIELHNAIGGLYSTGYLIWLVLTHKGYNYYIQTVFAIVQYPCTLASKSGRHLRSALGPVWGGGVVRRSQEDRTEQGGQHENGLALRHGGTHDHTGRERRLASVEDHSQHHSPSRCGTPLRRGSPRRGQTTLRAPLADSGRATPTGTAHAASHDHTR